MRVRAALALWLSLGCCENLTAQTTRIIRAVPASPYAPAVQIQEMRAAMIAAGAPVAAQPAAAESTGSAEQDAKAQERKQKRLEKIQQLQFDRRPSVILKTWLDPPPKPPKKSEQKPAEKPADAPEGIPPTGEVEAAPAAPTSSIPAVPSSTPPSAVEPAATPAASATDPTVANAVADAETATAEVSDDPAATASATDDAAKAAANQAAAEKKAAEEKAKAEEEARKQAEEEAKFDYELKVFVRNATLGQWAEVKTYLAGLEKEEGKALYKRMSTSLQAGAAGMQQGFDMNAIQQLITNAAAPAEFQKALSAAGQGPGAEFIEKNQFTMADIHGLIVAAPVELEDADYGVIGTILRHAIVSGNDPEVLLADLHVLPGSQEAALLKPRQTALLLFAAVEPIRAGDFLPKLDEAMAEQDAEGLNLLARYALAMHSKEQKDQYLVDAWKATQAVLTIPIPEGFEETEPPADAGADGDDVIPAPEGAPEAVEEFFDVSSCGQVAATAETAPAAASEAATPATEDATKQEEEKKKQEAEQKKAEAEKKAAEQKRIAKLKAAKQEAIQRAVELAPRVEATFGQKWLDDSFTSEQERGREILAAIGSAISTGMMSHPNDANLRLQTLKLQNTMVDALLRAAPDTAKEWRPQLTMLASGWLQEALVSYRLDQDANNRPGYRRDRYGNYFYFEDNGSMPMMQFNNGMAAPIRVTDLMEARPSEAWIDLIYDDLKPKYAETVAQLHLKLGEDKEAFPHIERLAATHADRAKALAEQFLRVWTTNHNPNEGREGYDPFFFYYGYERRAERIPLTRSKQERNLKELADLVKRLRALPIGELNESLLTQAFTTAHSKAEVYRLDSIENVFGSMENLKPRTLADLIQQMRGNLASVWRTPDVQQQNSTNRKQKDIQAELLTGYQVAHEVAKRGLEKHPDHWALLLAEAAVMYDENEFQQEIAKRSEYSELRAKALERFRAAAESYAKTAGGLRKEEQTTQPFEQWYYASLGAVDLARITPDKVPDLKQPALIRDALNTLPGPSGEHHRELFANNLFSRVSNAKPELKFRYLRTGFEIVGDHKMAREARKLLDYYRDLVTEIRLEARIDGSDVVGTGKPFGVFVNLVHTKEIERESGGFGRYLQNQNNNQSYYYNFGRPLENYRDKFEDIVRQALAEQFDIVSVTFQEQDVTSKALPEYGWRVTPYAYLLLKARGPQVDKISPLRLDLDFIDTSGYAILPVESATVPLDASATRIAARPAKNISITQTLDERQSDAGKLVLEIRATAQGLVPELDQIVDLKPAGFEVAEIDDGGPAVSKFDNEADESAIASERIWTIGLKASEENAKLPEKFQFAEAKVPVKEVVYQRYDDADLVRVEREFALQQKYGKTSYAGVWIPILGVGAAVALAIVGVLMPRKPEQAQTAQFRMPEQVTPFTVIGLLRDIRVNNGLQDTARSELDNTIGQLERHYFLQPETAEPNLTEIAQRWLSATNTPRKH